MVEKIKEVFRFMGNGITEPLLCKLEDQRYVVFKRLKNNEGPRVLANEFIAYKMARKLSLPIPNSGCAIIDQNTFIPDSVLMDFQSRIELYGLGFYSELREKVTQLTSPAQLTHIVNKTDIPKIILFDHLLRNEDRNPGNLLIDIKKDNRQLTIIDHTHIFYLGTMWDKFQLERMRNENDASTNDIVKKNEILYNILIESYGLDYNEYLNVSEVFNRTLSYDVLLNIMDEIPLEWGINNADKVELCRYLSYRKDSLPLMTSLFVKGGE